MYKRIIKVIKRNKIADSKKKRPLTAAKAAIKTQHQRVESINNWITEHNEINRLEKVFSDAKIVAWKVVTPNQKENLN